MSAKYKERSVPERKQTLLVYVHLRMFERKTTKYRNTRTKVELRKRDFQNSAFVQLQIILLLNLQCNVRRR